MQKKKARKGFLFLRRESVLPPCRGGARVPRRDKCGVLRRDTWVPPYKVRRSYGADRVVRPYAPCHSEPVRAAKQVPLGYRLARQSVFPQRKGRIPTPVTRSLARNDSASRCKAPSVRGLSAQPTGGEKNRGTSLPPSALRAATSLAEGGFGRPPP